MAATAIPAPPLLKITSAVYEPGIVVVDASGEIDATSAPELATAFEPIWTMTPSRVVLDLSRVTFLGTAGLTELLRVADRADSADVTMRLVGGTRCVDRAIEAAGFGPRLPVSPDFAHAMLR